MSRDSVMPRAEVEILSVQRRRQFTAEEKRQFVEETFQPGTNISLVARRHGISPSLSFRWRKLAEEGSLSAVDADESVPIAPGVPAGMLLVWV